MQSLRSHILDTSNLPRMVIHQVHHGASLKHCCQYYLAWVLRAMDLNSVMETRDNHNHTDPYLPQDHILYLPWVQESGMRSKAGKNQSPHRGVHIRNARRDADMVPDHNYLTCQQVVEGHTEVEGPYHSTEMVCAHNHHPLLLAASFSG